MAVFNLRIKFKAMRAQFTLANLKTQEGYQRIKRNLARILDTRILDCNLENSLLTFLYADPGTLDKIRRELHRIGYPVVQSKKQAAPEEDLTLTI